MYLPSSGAPSSLSLEQPDSTTPEPNASITTDVPAPTTPEQPASCAATTSSESSIDQILTDISAVTIEEITLCGTCKNAASALSKCIDCSKLICDKCVHAHKTTLATRNHRISRYSNALFTPPTSGGSIYGSIGDSSQKSSPYISPITDWCEIHRQPHRFFCRTCNTPACADCLGNHSGHHLDYIEDAIESAKVANKRLNTETRAAMIAIREAIDNIQRTYGNVELRSIQTATAVRNSMRRFFNALAERENALLKRIDQARQVKGKMLLTQKENLRMALIKLSAATDLLNEKVDPTTPMDIIRINERATKELKRISALRPELTPCEDDGIMFQPPDNGYLGAIASIGNVSISTSLLSSRAVMPAGANDQLQIASSTFCDPSPPMRNRPIFGAKRIEVRNPGYRPSMVFGNVGESGADGVLCRPWGVCCDHLGNIIVADRSNHRIQIFNQHGLFLHKFGTHGSEPGQFDRPAGVALDTQGHIVVADKDNHRIQIFKVSGVFILTFGEKGSRNGQFNYPWDVACNSTGQIVVSDTRNHRIQLFTRDGMFLNKYGFEGTSALWKHFDSPRGVCFTPKGNVIVTDFNNHRLVIVDPHFVQAQFLGQEGYNNKQFMRPQGVVCDDDGTIVIADSRNNRVQVIEKNGNFVWKFGLLGTRAGEMDRPSGICLSPEGRIIVVDFGNNRVQVF